MFLWTMTWSCGLFFCGLFESMCILFVLVECCILIRSCRLMALSSFHIVAVFPLVVLSVLERGILKTPNTTVDLSISPFSSVHFVPRTLNMLSNAHTIRTVVSSDKLTTLSYVFIVFIKSGK